MKKTETSPEVFRQKSGRIGFPPAPYKVCVCFFFNLEILLPKQLCTQQYLRRDAEVKEGKAERCVTQAHLCPLKHLQQSVGKYVAHTLEIMFKCPISWKVPLLPLYIDSLVEFIQPRTVHTKATCLPLTVYNFRPFSPQPVLLTNLFSTFSAFFY